MAVLNPGTPERTDPSERRASRRRPLSEVRSVTDVTVESECVDVVNASSGGVLVQSRLRLQPGSRTTIALGRADGPMNVKGRVVRSEVASISSNAVQYRTAIAFERHLDFIDQESTGDMTASPAGNLADFAGLFDAKGSESEQDLALNRW